MTPQAVEFIVEACVQHEGPITTTDWRDVARLAVRMGSAWEAISTLPPLERGSVSRLMSLPQPLWRLLAYNTLRGTLDAPTMPEEEHDAAV